MEVCESRKPKAIALHESEGRVALPALNGAGLFKRNISKHKSITKCLALEVQLEVARFARPPSRKHVGIHVSENWSVNPRFPSVRNWNWNGTSGPWRPDFGFLTGAGALPRSLFSTRNLTAVCYESPSAPLWVSENTWCPSIDDLL